MDNLHGDRLIMYITLSFHHTLSRSCCDTWANYNYICVSVCIPVATLNFGFSSTTKCSEMHAGLKAMTGQTYSEEQITRLQCKRNNFSRLWPAAGLRCATLIGQKKSCCYQQQSIEECHVKLFHHAICHKILASELQWHQGVLPPVLAH